MVCCGVVVRHRTVPPPSLTATANQPTNNPTTTKCYGLYVVLTSCESTRIVLQALVVVVVVVVAVVLGTV